MLIGLTGYAGSGKSTVAKHLVERHGFVLVKFAGRLKSMARAFGLSEDHIEGPLKDLPTPLLGGKTPRQLMQLLGQALRDGIHEDIWVDSAMADAYASLDQGGRVVIDDCRHHNEALAIRMDGGKVIKIIRPGVGPVNDHVSEKLDLKWDVLLLNDGPVEQLLATADLLVEG